MFDPDILGLLIAVFVASGVEFVEAFTIVLAIRRGKIHNMKQPAVDDTDEHKIFSAFKKSLSLSSVAAARIEGNA